MKLVLLAAAVLAYYYSADLKKLLSAGASDVKEEVEEKVETHPETEKGPTTPPVKLVGETDASDILSGVKRGQLMSHPVVTRNNLGHRIGVNQSEGVCGRDSASLQASAIAKIIEAVADDQCGAHVRPFNMPSHLENTLRRVGE